LEDEADETITDNASAVEGPHPGIAKDSELSALVSQTVIPPVSISLSPQGNIEYGLPAQICTSEIQSAGPATPRGGSTKETNFRFSAFP